MDIRRRSQTTSWVVRSACDFETEHTRYAMRSCCCCCCCQCARAAAARCVLLTNQIGKSAFSEKPRRVARIITRSPSLLSLSSHQTNCAWHCHTPSLYTSTHTHTHKEKAKKRNPITRMAAHTSRPPNKIRARSPQFAHLVHLVRSARSSCETRILRVYNKVAWPWILYRVDCFWCCGILYLPRIVR